MTQNKKQILDIFSQKLTEKFEAYCREYRQDTDLNNFVTYLIDRELIQAGAIKKYAISEAFEEVMARSQGRKTEAVEVLAHRFNLTPRSIWNALRKHRPASQFALEDRSRRHL